jgi:hypothetical protein
MMADDVRSHDNAEAPLELPCRTRTFRRDCCNRVLRRRRTPVRKAQLREQSPHELLRRARRQLQV